MSASEICPDPTPCAECRHYFDLTPEEREVLELIALQSSDG